ncbi:MAG: CAP domain-containing protein [Candidatus Falkowbacteria bacterium]
MLKKAAKIKKNRDSDGDGLSDFDEINYFGSDPYNADSDGDGIEDGEAVLNGQDPVGGGYLKDFFIPHQGNNYKPKSLHPKRLLFHAGGALLVKLIVILLVVFYPLAAWMTPDISKEEGAKIIALTNNLRASLSLDALKENSKLDQAASGKVEDMLINQYFAHLSPQGFNLEYFLKLAAYNNYAAVGENLAMGYSNASDVMSAWEKSPTHYSNLVDTNFKEIGVALAGGPYSGRDTIFIAQYFGLLKEGNQPETKKIETTRLADKISTPGTPTVLSDKIEEKPVLIAKNTKVIVNKPAGVKNEQIVKVEATLPPDTKTASLEVLNNQISLTPSVQVSSTTETKWTGQAVIQNSGQSVTPPIITISRTSGEIQKTEVPNNNISPQKTSIASQYWLFKNHPHNGLEKVFDISSIYFKILLALTILALLLNIFIKIKKQHPRLIFSGLGLILLLIIMIIF